MKTLNPLKILVVTECFYPDVYAINEIVEAMMKRGHRVTVLTGLPDYTTTKIPAQYQYGKNRHENYKGADVFRVATIARHHGPVWRSLSYLSFVVAGSLRAQTQNWKKTKAWMDDFDVIYVWEVSPVTMAVPAIVLQKRYRKPLFLYCMDIWPECVQAMGIREGSLMYQMIHLWSKQIYKRCDHIAVSSKPFFVYLEEKNDIHKSKMSYLPQYASAILTEQNFDKKPNGKVDFLFIGNIGKAQNLDCLLRAMAVFKGQKDVMLHMVGSGSELGHMKELAIQLGIAEQITFYGSIPFQEAVRYYSIADVCVLTLDGSNHIGDTLPGKLQTYMAAGKTVLAAANGAAKEIIADSRCGVCVPAGDHVAYGEILKTFVEHRERYADCGRNAREYFLNNFTEERHFTELEAQLCRMCK